MPWALTVSHTVQYLLPVAISSLTMERGERVRGQKLVSGFIFKQDLQKICTIHQFLSSRSE